MLHITVDCLDRWLNSFDEFRYDFLSFCHPVAKSLGYSFDFNQDILSAAHEGWKASHDMWLAERMGADTTGLSHIKIMGLLLHHLCRGEWVREIRVYDKGDVQFWGTDEERRETAKDFLGGPEAFFALQFALSVINWFEVARIDRQKPFEYRMTEDLSHDLMFYLLSGERNEFGLVLILKALYVRDPA